MTTARRIKKEIIDKVYDDYLRDYENWGSGGTNMDSVEKACKSQFEKKKMELSIAFMILKEN